VRVSATGGELPEHVGGALKQEVDGSALPLERGGSRKQQRHNQKEQVTKAAQRNHLPRDD